MSYQDTTTHAADAIAYFLYTFFLNRPQGTKPTIKMQIENQTQESTNGASVAMSADEKRERIIKLDLGIKNLEAHTETVRKHVAEKDFNMFIQGDRFNHPYKLYNSELMPQRTFMNLYLNDCQETLVRWKAEIESLIK